MPDTPTVTVESTRRRIERFDNGAMTRDTATQTAMGKVIDAPPVDSDHAGPIIPSEWTLDYDYSEDGFWVISRASLGGGKVKANGQAGAVTASRRWYGHDRRPFLGMPEWFREVAEAQEPDWTPNAWEATP